MLDIKNLGTRSFTGIIFVAVLILGIVYNTYSFLLVFSVIAVLALYEFYNLIRKTVKGSEPNKIFNTLGGLLLFISSYSFFSTTNIAFPFFALYILYILLLFISELFLRKENPIKSLAYAVLGQVYVALPLSLLPFLAFSYAVDGSYHYALILAVFIFIWVNDSFAYLWGSLLGKHRMFERISPKKSWEGFAGGAICSVIASVVYANYYPSLPLWAWIGVAIVVVVFGTLGDLVESLIKRTLNVKDSGNLLPGHGGILDRIDSVIFAIPALFVYIMLLRYFIN